MSHHNSSGSSSKKTGSRLIGGAVAGVVELAVFHPVDTIAKRLMHNERISLSMAGDAGKSLTSNLSSVLFRENANASVLTKYRSLFPGFGFAAGYKILQRTYKFGGQPVVYDAINNKTPLRTVCTDRFGDKWGKVIVNGVAGACLGVGEVILLPLDVLKIKMQTNPDALKTGSFRDWKIQELYKGASWTALRNGPGSFALFGASAIVTYNIFRLEDAKQATFTQTTVASCVGAVASIVVAQPLDVLKTRIQSKGFNAKHESGFTIIKNMLKNEGVGSFAKGLVPKVLTIGPKLAFSLTIAQSVMHYLENNF